MLLIRFCSFLYNIEEGTEREISVNVRNVLEIAQTMDGSQSAGKGGLERRVRFIEVMEVPEVESWATEGVLVVTNLYSVKDDVAKQVDIVRVLIKKKAAGIIVKMGRFVEQLPPELIELADKNQFPIITIPKDIAYIDLLTPLYEMLHDDVDAPADNDALHSFKDMKFGSVEKALEHLSTILNGSAVYIEDAQGLLLYASGRLFRDPWRKSNAAFSVPADKTYKESLVKWKNRLEKDDHSYIYLPGKLSRLIIPLYTRQDIFAFIHLPYHNRTLLNSLTKKSIESIQYKIYETLMSELIELQKQCREQADEFQRMIAAKGKRQAKVVLYFQNDQKFVPRSSRILDYDCLLQKKWATLIEEIPNVETSIVFEKERRMYALVIFSELLPMEQLADEVEQMLGHFPIQGTRVGISPVFYHYDELDAKVCAVTKMLDIGREFHPAQKIYSYHQIGIYEFLIKLSQESSAREYAHQILGGLEVERDPGLIEKLIVYLQENGNASKAAEKLFIHRRTMTNRLLKIKSLLNMDLDNPEHIFILQFCLKIKRLNEQ